LRATIDWSYELLSEEERILFLRLSVFTGGFTLDAVERVCSGEGVAQDAILDLLSHLVDKSLVLVAEQGGEARYRLLETIKQYAGERLEGSDEATAIKRRHSRFFLTLAETAEPEMLGPTQVAWVKRLETEHDNLRAALDWGAEEASETETGLRLASALALFWIIKSHFTEGLTRLRALLESPSASARSSVRARAYRALGGLHYRRADAAAGDFHRAREYYRRGLAAFREVGDEAQVAYTLTDLGRVETDLEDYTSGRPLLEKSLGLQRRLGNEHGVALAIQNLGWLYFLRNEYASARPLLLPSERVRVGASPSREQRRDSPETGRQVLPGR
jgi:tetratricopeptide (TPR) repeat protein